ncbi:MAG TPA: lantibiotic dehydratase [Ferruginibacter sp.]|nr:lantibiotic dehydratase [Ferruginibacter sp.]
MTNKTPYSFHPDLVLRTPRLPLPEELTAQTLPVLLTDPLFLESLYIASPVVYDECIKWKQHDSNAKKIERLTATVLKYYLRSSSRSTPFGLFSGCSCVEWQNEAAPIVINDGVVERHIRLDMHYLCLLAQKIATAPGITELLVYYVNNSAYKIGDELRYVEYLFVDGEKKYQITAVQWSEYLAKIINAAKDGKKISELIALIVAEDITKEEAKTFVYDLIDAQVITSELDPKLTGNGLLDQIITTLERIVAQQRSVKQTIQILHTVKQKLKNIASLQAGHVAAYREIIALLNEVEPVLDESKIFQVDSTRKIETGNLDIAIQDELQSTLAILNKLSIPYRNKNLDFFIQKFQDKYGTEEMPLLQVLDTETGIGYLNTDEGYLTPLIDGLIIPSKEITHQLSWGKVEQFLHKKLATKTADNCIVITDEEVKEFSAEWKDLPASISMVFKIIDSNTNTIQIDAIGNATAASLLARFAHTDPKINKIIYDIAKKEQGNRTETIYAEIIHLPENRMGNVLLRPAFREYEIPYLAQSAVAPEKQIDVSDLYISIKNNAVFLRSKRLDKQIIPRLSTAHNFSFNSLPVYQLLCDLQSQGMRNYIGFNWGSNDQLYTALPRVMYKNAILSLARWIFTADDIKQFAKTDNIVMEEVLQFKQKYQLPKHVVLTEGDNELLVDLEDKLSVTVWVNSIRKKNNFMLKEYIYPANGVTDNQQRIYSNQFVATLFKDGDNIPSRRSYKTIDHTVKRSFALGSEWAYYKLYCGLKTADKILSEAIKPLTDELLRLKLIDQYFFIRYNDPEFHIRLRFHLTDINKIGELIQLVNNYLEPFIGNGFIWKEQADIYTRELERYGSNTIGLAESLFYYDSLATLEMLDMTEGDAREVIRWLWAIRSIDELLNSFGFSIKQKSELLLALKDAFAAEFKVDKPLGLQLNDRYREHKLAIEQMMNEGNETKSEMFPLIEILQRKKQQVAEAAENILQLNKNNALEMPLNELLNSLIHMMVNRIIKADSRMHEMVIYNFISRHYQSAIAKMNIDEKV